MSDGNGKTGVPSGPPTAIERLSSFHGPDLNDLCDAAEAAITDGGGFGWLTPPSRHVMEAYWRGVLVIPERQLYVARLEGTIAGSAQLLFPSRNNESQASNGQLTTFFLAPWARGYGLAKMLVQAVADGAREGGLSVLNLDVRKTQSRAIQIYEQLGFQRWGEHPRYALVNGQWYAGYYYCKDLSDLSDLAAD